VAEAFDIEGHAGHEYNDGDLEEIEDSYGFTHVLDKRSGEDKQIKVITVTLVAGCIDQENAAATPVAFRTWALATYKSKSIIEIFDDDGALAYKGILTAVDKSLRGNLTMFQPQIKDFIELRMVLTAQGAYTTWATLASATYVARP